MAHPDGTFTLTQSVSPVRKYASGAWKELDATLVRRSDGTVTPALTTTNLVLSGGGDGPLAAMKDHGRSLTLAVPASIGQLPSPSLDGSSATYPDVLDGVDLKVTADSQGGFSEVFIVKDAEAAANPALDMLALSRRDAQRGTGHGHSGQHHGQGWRRSHRLLRSGPADVGLRHRRRG